MFYINCSLSTTCILLSASFRFFSSCFSRRSARSRSRFSSRYLSFSARSRCLCSISSLILSFSTIASISFRYLSFILSVSPRSLLLATLLAFLDALPNFLPRLSTLVVTALCFLRGGEALKSADQMRWYSLVGILTLYTCCLYRPSCASRCIVFVFDGILIILFTKLIQK